MDPLYDAICHGCLNSERKISNLHDSSLKECFKQILKETTLLSYNTTLQLCFECVAILVKIKRFQERVKISAEKLLNECLKKNYNHSQTSLQINNLYNISLSEHKDVESYDVIHTKPIAPNINENTNDSDFENDLETDADIDSSKQEIYAETDLSKKEIFSEDIISKKETYAEVKLSKKEIEEERSELKLSDEYANAMFKCDNCVITFTNVEDLDEHVSRKHDVKSKYNCSICKCVFNSAISFKYHTNRHKKRYQCNACYIRFVYKRDVIKHYNIVHCHGVEHLIYDKDIPSQTTEAIPELSEKLDCIFACDVCEKQFRWKTSLRKHLERHRIESGQKRKPYCEPCKLYFATSSNLKKHVRTSSKHQIHLKLRKLKDSNEEEKNDAIKEIRSSVNSSRQTFSCAQCDKRFQWHGNLMRHMNNHKAKASGELVCVPCNRSFSSIATYQQHMKISKKHVTENDFKYMCSDCGKRFADKTRLKDHVDWEHLKNFVHTCSECQKPFKTRTSLYLHKQVVHQKDTSEHLCDHCGKHFPNHSKLRIHIRALHSAVAAYKCSSCGAKFAWHSCLSRHIRRLHKKIT